MYVVQNNTLPTHTVELKAYNIDHDRNLQQEDKAVVRFDPFLLKQSEREYIKNCLPQISGLIALSGFTIKDSIDAKSLWIIMDGQKYFVTFLFEKFVSAAVYSPVAITLAPMNETQAL